MAKRSAASAAAPSAAASPFKPDHLYIDDDGRVSCGKHIGVEATFKPWAFSDLGAVVAVVHKGARLACEDTRCRRPDPVRS